MVMGLTGDLASLDLDGRVVLVTGGSRGIGRAIAAALVAAGARVAICARDPDACDAAAGELGDEVAPFCADIADEAAVHALVQGTVDRFGRLDGLVNNAGRFGGGSVTALEPDAVLDAMNGKPIGALLMVRHALEHLRRSDQARIVNVAGASAERVTVGASVTAIANASTLALTSYLARELIADRVCVNAVVPGFVRTGVWEERIAKLAGAEGVTIDEAATAVLDRNNIGHSRWGRPEEVAAVVLFLLSNWARFVTGTALRVDGGQAATVAY